MFESKLNIYTKQKAAERKVFWLFTEKVLKIGNIKGSNINLKLYFAFVNDQTHNVFYIHVKAGASSFLLISNILTKLNILLLIRWKCEKQSIFPKCYVLCSHNSLFLFQMGLFEVNNSSRTCLNQN